MRKATKIAGAALQGVVVAAALGAAAIFVVPRLLGWQTVTVMSGSMAPAYAVDAELAIAPVDPADVRVGDVIAFQPEADRPMITHRVVAIEHDAGDLDVRHQRRRQRRSRHQPRRRLHRARPGGLRRSAPRVVRAYHPQLPSGLRPARAPGLLLIGQEILTIRRDRRAKKAATTPWPPPLAAEARNQEVLEHEVHV